MHCSTARTSPTRRFSIDFSPGAREHVARPGDRRAPMSVLHRVGQSAMHLVWCDVGGNTVQIYCDNGDVFVRMDEGHVPRPGQNRSLVDLAFLSGLGSKVVSERGRGPRQQSPRLVLKSKRRSHRQRKAQLDRGQSCRNSRH